MEIIVFVLLPLALTSEASRRDVVVKGTTLDPSLIVPKGKSKIYENITNKIINPYIHASDQSLQNVPSRIAPRSSSAPDAAQRKRDPKSVFH